MFQKKTFELYVKHLLSLKDEELNCDRKGVVLAATEGLLFAAKFIHGEMNMAKKSVKVEEFYCGMPEYECKKQCFGCACSEPKRVTAIPEISEMLMRQKAYLEGRELTKEGLK